METFNKEFTDDWHSLVTAVKADIADDDRATNEPDDNEPGIQLTVACNDDGDQWSYQTGDNSFTGGAYGLPHWAVIYVTRDTKILDAVDEIISQLENLLPD